MFKNKEDEDNPYALRLKLENLRIVPVDSFWKLAYTKENEPRRKMISVSNLSFSVFYVNDKFRHVSKTSNKHKISQVHAIRNFNRNIEAEQFPEKNYILHPMRFQVKLTMNNVDSTDHLVLPEVHLNILLKSSIVIACCKEQIETITRFQETMNDITAMKSNLHLRPLYRVSSEMSLEVKKQWWKAWWKYIIMAVIEKNRSNINIFSAFEKYFVIRKYISLYKRLKKFVETINQGTGALVEGPFKGRTDQFART
jgi:hypothetical protein